MYTNAGMDLEKHRKMQEAQDAEDKFFEKLDRREREAEINNQGRQDACPPLLVMGTVFNGAGHDAETGTEVRYTQVHDPYGLQGRSHYEMTRDALAYGNIRPAAITVDPDGKAPAGRVFKSASDEEAVLTGLACWKCGDATIHQDETARLEDRWREFQGMFPYYVLPHGRTIKDICLTCGAQLMRKRS